MRGPAHDKWEGGGATFAPGTSIPFEHGAPSSTLLKRNPATRDAKRRTPNTEHWTPSTGHETPNTEHRTPDAGHRTRCPTSDTDRWTRPLPSPPNLEGDPAWRGSALGGCYLEPPPPLKGNASSKSNLCSKRQAAHLGPPTGNGHQRTGTPFKSKSGGMLASKIVLLLSTGERRVSGSALRVASLRAAPSRRWALTRCIPFEFGTERASKRPPLARTEDPVSKVRCERVGGGGGGAGGPPAAAGKGCLEKKHFLLRGGGLQVAPS